MPNISEEMILPSLEPDASGEGNKIFDLEDERLKDLEATKKELEKNAKNAVIKEAKLLNKKLKLSEEVEINQVSNDDLSLTSLVNTLIKNKWDSIDLFNSILLSFRQANNTEAEEILNDIINEEYVHVGQLEKLAQLINPLAGNIDLGQHETESQVGEN